METAAALLTAWSQTLLAEARADGHAQWEPDLAGFEDPEQAAGEREYATVALVTTVVTFFFVDDPNAEKRAERFLAYQTYRREDSAARYEVRFFGSPVQDAYVRVDTLQDLDLVDLHSVFGFVGVAVGRRDGRALDAAEREVLQRAVVDDFQFDYEEDEFEFTFESSPREVVVYVKET